MVGHEREVAAAAAVATAAAAAVATAAVSVASVPRRRASPLRLEGTVEPDFLPLLLLTVAGGEEKAGAPRGRVRLLSRDLGAVRQGPAIAVFGGWGRLQHVHTVVRPVAGWGREVVR